MTKMISKIAAVATTVAMFAGATPALAYGGHSSRGGSTEINNSISIDIDNSATVTNSTSASASTGGNTAGGSEGGNGGSGGDVENNDGGTNTGGDGGAGGDGGLGGLVTSGDAGASASTVNDVNSTTIKIQQADCGCGSEGGHSRKKGKTEIDNSVDVYVDNDHTYVTNSTTADATTGDNKAKGSEGGNGGSGGDVEDNDAGKTGRGHGHGYHGGSSATGSNEGGEGGAGGDGDTGGEVKSGEAWAEAVTVNVVNSTVLRVRR